MSPFKANYVQDPRMGFEGRKKGKYQGTKKFIEKIKEIQEEAKAVLGKVQEEMKKYVDRKRKEVNDYKVGDLVMLSTKDMKYQMVGRRMKKLIERFVGPYKIKKIVPLNVVELEFVRNNSRREICSRGLGLNDKLCPPLHLLLLDFSRIIFKRKK